MQARDFFQLIRDFDHSLGIYLTFPLDKEVVEKIRDSGGSRAIVLHDARHGATFDNCWDSRVLSIPAFPVQENRMNLFHSKLAVLKGEDQIRVIVGSQNLTRTSFSANKEVACLFDFPINSPQCRAIRDFLASLNCSHSLWSRAIDELTALGPVTDQTDGSVDFEFISNSGSTSIKQSFLQTLKRLEPPGEPFLHIAAPFTSQLLGEGFHEMIGTIKPKEIRLYVRSNAKIPKEVLTASIPVKVFAPSGKGRQGFHAKMIALEYPNEMVAFVGSANFTAQGFFLTQTEGGNQENGVVFRTQDKQDLMEWFDKGWAAPVSPHDWSPSEGSDSDAQLDLSPYAWAERIDASWVRLLIFLPDEKILRKVRVDGRKVMLAKDQHDLYSVNVSSKDQFLTLQISNTEPIKVAIFNPNQYEEIKSSDDVRLFSHYVLPIESWNESDLRIAIAEGGIRVGEGSDQVIEPPLLEQFYYNVRAQMRSIRRRRIPTADLLNELKTQLYEVGATSNGTQVLRLKLSQGEYSVFNDDILLCKFVLSGDKGIQLQPKQPPRVHAAIDMLYKSRGQHGATGLYLITHLVRLFDAKGWKEFSDICLRRAEEICIESRLLDFTSFLKFVRNRSV